MSLLSSQSPVHKHVGKKHSQACFFGYYVPSAFISFVYELSSWRLEWSMFISFILPFKIRTVIGKQQ